MYVGPYPTVLYMFTHVLLVNMCFLHVQTRHIHCYMSKYAMGRENMIFITPLFCPREGKYDFYTTPVSILGGIYIGLTLYQP